VHDRDVLRGKIEMEAYMLRRASQSALSHAYRQALRIQGAEIDGSVLLIGRPIVARLAESTIKVGARSVLTSKSRFTALGVNHPVILRTLLPGAQILIGRDVGISGGSICAAHRVEIGDGCLLGANVVVADTDFHVLRNRSRRYMGTPPGEPSDGVRIGRNVFIGTGSVILKGVSIGDDAVIGAGSVVARSVPAGAVCAGSPARVLYNWVEADDLATRA
jgi:acetyltransferase-like isoleucine patch superfamily enzyme